MNETETETGTALADHTVAETLAAIGARTPAPGGGAVASLTAALASATGAMVVSYSLGKKSLDEHQAMLEQARVRLQDLGRRALDLAADDARAYTNLNGLWKLEASDPERVAKWDEAVAAAIAAPEGVLASSLELLELLGGLVDRSNANLASDLAIAAILAEAAARAAAWNIRINLPSVADRDEAAAIEDRCRISVDRARGTTKTIEDALSPR